MPLPDASAFWGLASQKDSGYCKEEKESLEEIKDKQGIGSALQVNVPLSTEQVRSG